MNGKNIELYQEHVRSGLSNITTLMHDQWLDFNCKSKKLV
jgi:hypothetical protein